MSVLSGLFSFAFLTLALAWYAAGKDCETLDGKWYNQLGDEISLKHGDNGTLLGEYRTKYAGETHSAVLGYAPYGSPDATFAFTVVWRNGSSTRVWTGQCFICADGAQEKLLTSWLQRSKVNTCIDKWKSTMVGRDAFTRCEQQDGPCLNPNETPPSIEPVFKNWDPEIQNKSCSLNGNWYNLLGSEMIVEQRENNRVTGEFRTAVEREKGTAGSSHSKVLGIGQLGGTNSTFAFFVIYRNGASVAGWVGQCHFCGENKTETMETTWLLRTQIDKCGDNWKSTYYGENTFTHTETTPGPRKKDDTHTPDRSGGEEEKDKKPTVCKGCQLMGPLTVLSFSVILSLAER